MYLQKSFKQPPLSSVKYGVLFILFISVQVAAIFLSNLQSSFFFSKRYTKTSCQNTTEFFILDFKTCKHKMQKENRITGNRNYAMKRRQRRFLQSACMYLRITPLRLTHTVHVLNKFNARTHPIVLATWYQYYRQYEYGSVVNTRNGHITLRSTQLRSIGVIVHHAFL